jgi:Domain of unknown function (DUF5943)
MPDSKSFQELVSKLELDTTGSLSLNGLQMVLMPRHFFRYIMREVHKAVTPVVFRKIYWQAGYDGAVSFCDSFQRNHGCSAQQAVEGYLGEMSIRGWGSFSIQALNPQEGTMEVLLTNSALVAESSIPSGIPSGNLAWEGAMLGAMAFLQKTLSGPYTPGTQVEGREIPGRDGGPAAFQISVTPKAAKG